MNFVEQRGSEILKRLPAGPAVGAEVGVWDGRLSQYLLTTKQDLRLYMVDRWQDVESSHRYRQSNSQMAKASPDEFVEVHRRAMKVCRRFPDRTLPLRGESVEMAEQVAHASLDFVFVDADHSYEGVKEDLEAWYPKLKSGGLLCGHDWEHPDYQDSWGVSKAVNEFAEKMQASVELGLNRTWFLVWQ